MIPPHVVNESSPVWHSDIVMSDGGTMNREAVALGVRVGSISRENIGAEDRYLAYQRGMVLIESAQGLAESIKVARRNRPSCSSRNPAPALSRIKAEEDMIAQILPASLVPHT